MKAKTRITSQELQVEVLRIGDYWRVLRNRTLVATFRRKVEAEAFARVLRRVEQQ